MPFCSKPQSAAHASHSKIQNAKIKGFLHTFSNNQKITGLLRLFTSDYILSTKHSTIISIYVQKITN